MEYGAKMRSKEEPTYPPQHQQRWHFSAIKRGEKEKEEEGGIRELRKEEEREEGTEGKEIHKGREGEEMKGGWEEERDKVGGEINKCDLK